VNTVILNWKRPLWEGGQEIVKRSGRSEPVWVVIHICMETTLGISLYSYLYLKLAKCCVFLITSYVFSSTKNLREQEGGIGSGWEVEWRRGGLNNVYTCK
jgi:hypothetical protein